MKKLLAVLLMLVYSASLYAQSAIIRGEVTPGVYENIKTDGTGRILSSGTTTSAVSVTTTTPTVTNASANVLAANASRRYLMIQNNDAAGIVYINFGAAATVAHLKLLPGQNVWMDAVVSTQAVAAIGSIASNANVVVMEGQ